MSRLFERNTELVQGYTYQNMIEVVDNVRHGKMTNEDEYVKLGLEMYEIYCCGVDEWRCVYQSNLEREFEELQKSQANLSSPSHWKGFCSKSSLTDIPKCFWIRVSVEERDSIESSNLIDGRQIVDNLLAFGIGYECHIDHTKPNKYFPATWAYKDPDSGELKRIDILLYMIQQNYPLLDDVLGLDFKIIDRSLRYYSINFDKESFDKVRHFVLSKVKENDMPYGDETHLMVRILRSLGKDKEGIDWLINEIICDKRSCMLLYMMYLIHGDKIYKSLNPDSDVIKDLVQNHPEIAFELAMRTPQNQRHKEDMMCYIKGIFRHLRDNCDYVLKFLDHELISEFIDETKVVVFNRGTMLQYYVQKPYTEETRNVIFHLLEKGSRVNKKNSFDNTPMEFAVKKCELNLINMMAPRWFGMESPSVDGSITAFELEGFPFKRQLEICLIEHFDGYINEENFVHPYNKKRFVSRGSILSSIIQKISFLCIGDGNWKHAKARFYTMEGANDAEVQAINAECGEIDCSKNFADFERAPQLKVDLNTKSKKRNFAVITEFRTKIYTGIASGALVQYKDYKFVLTGATKVSHKDNGVHEKYDHGRIRYAKLKKYSTKKNFARFGLTDKRLRACPINDMEKVHIFPDFYRSDKGSETGSNLALIVLSQNDIEQIEKDCTFLPMAFVDDKGLENVYSLEVVGYPTEEDKSYELYSSKSEFGDLESDQNFEVSNGGSCLKYTNETIQGQGGCPVVVRRKYGEEEEDFVVGIHACGFRYISSASAFTTDVRHWIESIYEKKEAEMHTSNEFEYIVQDFIDNIPPDGKFDKYEIQDKRLMPIIQSLAIEFGVLKLRLYLKFWNRKKARQNCW